MSIEVKHLLEFGPFQIDPEQRLLIRDQQPIALAPKAFDLLLLLAERNGQVILKEELMTALWPDTFVEESNLGQHVFQLRKAMGDRSYIVTVPGRGYRLAGQVKSVPTRENGAGSKMMEYPASPAAMIAEKDGGERKRRVPRSIRPVMIVGLLLALLAMAGVAMVRLLTPAPPTVLRVKQITHSGRVEPYGKVLSDGPRLYFTERMGGVGVLAQAPAAGGEAALIPPSVRNVTLYDIDPSRSRLLIGAEGSSSDHPLWIIATEGGSARRVGDASASNDAAWSPDGKSIFFDHASSVYVVSETGGEPRQLFTVPGTVIFLRVSPDGSLLRFTLQDWISGGFSLWEAGADGGNPHPLSFGWKATLSHWGEGECCGEWTPDGSYFVFREARDRQETLWAVREKGNWLHKSAGAPVQIYASADHLSNPAFSPDGKSLFLANYQERRELVRYNSAQKLFVPYLGGIPARLVSFSRDGAWLAYRNESDGSLWRSHSDGSEPLQLTFPPMEAYHCTWSPDGQRIVFGARLPGETSRLYSVSRNGGKIEALTPEEALASQPSWSADGNSIVYRGWISNKPGARHSGLYVLDLNTRQSGLLEGSQDFDGPHWSPDGKYLAASDEANKKYMLYDFSRRRWRELADGPPYGWGIRWSSDSRYVYYQHPTGEEQPMFRARISDGKVEQITSARQILRADVLGYSMTGLTPDNSPLASLIHKDSDVYALELEWK